MYKYIVRVMRDGVVGGPEEMESAEDMDRLLKHAHIHSAELVGEVKEAKEEKKEVNRKK